MHLLVAAHDFYPDPGSGGTGRYVYETARRLADRDHRVSVLTRRRGDTETSETVAGVAVRRYDLSIAGETAPGVLSQLPGALRAVSDRVAALPDPDLVSFQGPVTSALVSAVVAEDVPRSLTFHSPWPAEYRIKARHRGEPSRARRELNARLRRLVEGHVVDEADDRVALSAYMRERLRDAYGSATESESETAVVPGGVDTERFRPDAGEYDRMGDADGGRDEVSVLTVRRLSARMGHGLLLRAFARVADAHSGVHLYVAGDGPRRAALERAAAALGVADRVTFLGYVPDKNLSRAYAAADCFALPTTELEGFGLATLEALASGTPVVATPVGGTVELLSGLADRLPVAPLVEAATPGALGDGLAAWARLSKAERDAAGRTCRAYAADNYPWERTARLLDARYAALR